MIDLDEITFSFVDVEIQATKRTPYVKLNKAAGIIELRGKSFPENATNTYWSLNRWIAEYIAYPAKTTKINIALSFMNSGTSRLITEMLKNMHSTIGIKSNLVVNWYYEQGDTEMESIGEYYKELLDGLIVLHEVDKI